MEEINPLFLDSDCMVSLKRPTNESQGNDNVTESQSNDSINKNQLETSEKSKKDRIKCPECNRYTAENNEQLTRHIRKQHRGENPYQCYMCDYSTYNSVVFEEHIRIHKGIKPFTCKYCPHSSASKRNLQKHELIHRPDNPLKCHKCHYIARHQKGLDWHSRKFHDKNDDDKCQYCNKVFTSASGLAKHLSVTKKCDECDYVSCSKHLIDLHGVKKHGWLKIDKAKKPNGFECAECSWSSSSKLKIMLHLVHHPNQTVNESFLDVSILRKYGIME
ncbi:zinc finger protein 208 [Danaus plexippus plexippus]|uniref:Zinc finger protein 208 n=1 Tax=Danaus plexippus plexippus TaxID=278856 RepID=A0A212F495_DANPL|nr:zinc finger protein 208 [Danaus plexippus plexippus]